MPRMSERDLSRWELVDVHVGDSYRAIRNDDLLLWWTPFDELNLHVLNVFSPKGAIFWNIAEYRTFQDGAAEFMHRMRDQEGFRDAFNGAIQDAGAERKSPFARRLLGGISRYFGTAYEPVPPQPSVFLDAFRHMSVAVPDACRPAVSRYFHRQAEVFGETATRACAEDVNLVLVDLPPGPMAEQLFCATVAVQPAPTRRAFTELARGVDDPHRFATADHFKFFRNAGVSLSPYGLTAGSDWFEDFVVLARFRADMVMRHGALPVIEHAKAQLDDTEWNLLELADLREELRGVLGQALVSYPIIDTNPFELTAQRSGT